MADGSRELVIGKLGCSQAQPPSRKSADNFKIEFEDSK
jgi:hypothetical protein